MMDGGGLMQRIREAHALVGNLGEELVRMEQEDKDGFWAGSDFFDLTLSFIASIKAFGFDIERESQGEKLIDAIQQQDAPLMSRFRFEITNNVKRLVGSKRSGYMFFIFWPALHTTLNAADA